MADRQPEHRDNADVWLRAGRLEVRLTGPPATIATIGTVGVVAYCAYKVLNNEQLCGSIIAHTFMPGSVLIKFIAENEKAANQALHVFSSNEILETFNEALKEYSKEQNCQIGKFDGVGIVNFSMSNIKAIEWSNLKKEADELREKFEKELNMTFGTSRKRPGSVATERESVTAKRLAPSEKDPTSCSYTQTGLIEGNHGEERNDRQLQQSLYLEELLEKALTLEDFVIFMNNKCFADVCDVMKDEFDDPLALQIGYMIQYHKALVMEKEIARASEVVEKLVKLIKDKVPVICPDKLLAFAERICRGKQHMEAALFYELSASFYSVDRSTVNSAHGIADSVKGLRRISKSLVKLNEDAHQEIIKDYIIPVMRAMVEKVRNTTYKNRVPWCLHYIEVTMCLVKDWDARETILLETMELMGKSNDGDRDEKQLYGHLLCNLGQNYEKKSDPKQAHHYYQHAFQVYETATDMTDEERREYHKDVQENLDRVSKLLPRED